ncbi:unnamed protein product [Cylindrotheca closterium]|uniref:CHCH domain-containing protein n=1 Tax=Cylindrotheca closterium TaxID=2856 RepID=A0AAD2FHL8_9STRA|nr:unnamed protein product [Cylindrotheca closterium]
MARSRRGGGSFGSSRRPAAPVRRAAPPARPASTSSSTPAPMQQSSGGGMLSGIGSTIAQGMAFGTGSAVAHRAVGAAAGAMSGDGGQPAAGQPVEVAGDMQQQQQLQGACANDKQMFFECLQHNRGDQQACSFLYENLQTCQRESSTMQFN